MERANAYDAQLLSFMGVSTIDYCAAGSGVGRVWSRLDLNSAGSGVARVLQSAGSRFARVQNSQGLESAGFVVDREDEGEDQGEGEGKFKVEREETIEAKARIEEVLVSKGEKKCRI